jgi:hypothetical protein
MLVVRFWPALGSEDLCRADCWARCCQGAGLAVWMPAYRFSLALRSDGSCQADCSAGLRSAGLRSADLRSDDLHPDDCWTG